MRNFKKAIAILLAVLMVAFSVPFTALAGNAEADTDAVVKLYVTPYVSDTVYGFQDASTATIVDPSNITEEALGGTDMAVYIAVENLDKLFAINLMWYFDTDALQADSVLEQPSSINALKSNFAVADDATAAQNDDGNLYVAALGTNLMDTSGITETTYTAGSVDGIVVGVFKMTLLTDGTDITDWTYDNYEGMLGFDSFGDAFFTVDKDDLSDQIFAVGTEDAVSTFDVEYAAPSAPPQPTGVTYTFADGTSTVVTDGNAPANTADVYATNDNGTHAKTVYSWTADGDNFKEVGTTSTEDCENFKAGKAAVHTADAQEAGYTASWNCTKCGSSQAETAIPVAHSYTDNVVAATCSAQGYTEHTCSVCGDSYVDTYTSIDANNHVNTHNVDATAATCVATGFTAGVYCNDCMTWVSGHTETPVDKTNHAEGCVLVDDPAVAATCVAGGKTAGSHYSICGTVNVAQEDTPVDTVNGHNWQQEGESAATCVTPGATNYRCSICQATKSEDGSVNPNNHVNTVNDEGTAATCVATGFTPGVYCNDCQNWVSGHDVINIDKTNHVGTVDIDPTTVVAATCQTQGYSGDAKCSACGDVVTAGTDTDIDPDNHVDAEPTIDPAIAPTRAEAGKTAGSHWACCGKVETAQEVIPALGVMITVNNSDLGTVKVNDTVAGDEAVKVAYGQPYTLTAEAKEGVEFIGWMVGGKIVSQAATYTTAAFADTEYFAVFDETSAATFSVTFVDKFNNVLATYTNNDVAAWDAIPEMASACDGYKVVGFDKTLDQIKAATGDIFVTAQYEKVEKTFTVTANGATITVAGNDYQDTAEVTGYDVPVTVSANGATAWTVNGKEAGFGESYTFYVTSDVTITFTTTTVEATPVVTAVNGNGDLQADGTKVRFLASRNVPTNYKVVESGYLYGKEIAADALVLENVGVQPAGAGSKVFNYKNSNTSNDGQFAFTFGVAAHTTASARAYLIVSLNGVVQAPIYADAQIYNY